MINLSGKTLERISNVARLCFIVIMFLTLVTLWYLNKERGYLHNYLSESSDLRLIVEELADFSKEAIHSKEGKDFQRLRQAYQAISQGIVDLQKGKTVDDRLVFPKTPPVIQSVELAQFTSAWNVLKPNFERILNGQDLLVSL